MWLPGHGSPRSRASGRTGTQTRCQRTVQTEWSKAERSDWVYAVRKSDLYPTVVENPLHDGGIRRPDRLVPMVELRVLVTEPQRQPHQHRRRDLGGRQSSLLRQTGVGARALVTGQAMVASYNWFFLLGQGLMPALSALSWASPRRTFRR